MGALRKQSEKSIPQTLLRGRLPTCEKKGADMVTVTTVLRQCAHGNRFLFYFITLPQKGL